jgi:hypothetical protein
MGTLSQVNLINKKRAYRWLAATLRWMHIYVSMLGLAVILFFSATGFTLNHPTWFFRETIQNFSGELAPKWLDTGAIPPPGWDESDFGFAVSKLEVVESLRSRHSLRGSVSSFLTFEDECEVGFEGPGYVATAKIDRKSGRYSVDVVTTDFISVLNDLHKGRHSGRAWSVFIDLCALVGIAASLSGFGLIFFIKLRRNSGLILALVGLFVLCGLSFWAMG